MSDTTVKLTMPVTNIAKILPRANYDVRCVECERTETKGKPEDPTKHQMLAFKFEVVAPTTKKLPGYAEEQDIAGITFPYWLVLYGKSIAELEAQGDLSEDEQQRLEKYRSLRDNQSYGTYVKLGSLHYGMGLPLEIQADEDLINPTDYIGKTINVIGWGSVDRQDGVEKVYDASGKEVPRISYKINSFEGPARWPEMHPQQ